jgi:Fe-S-cluster-containing dehydrogenase component
MKKWNMIIDGSRCHNCYNCFVATKDEYVDNEFPGYTAPQPLHGHEWVDIERTESGQWPMVEAHYRPVMCNHCDDAPCMKAATGDAIKKRDDGIVIIDPEQSKGQKQIVDACPYGAVYWNEERQIPQAWPFDAHLLDRGWDKTKLETVCPTGVFKSIKVTDVEMMKLADDEDLKTLEPKSEARPRVYYKNRHLFDTCFLGGTVVTEKTGVEECVEGATVVATHGEKEIGRAESDAFGDFKISGLSRNLGAVTLTVEYAGGTNSLEAELEDSVYVGPVKI